MQSNTQAHLRKKDRHRSRKFSAEEPYDLASDETLANSSLSGRKFSLQPGTVVQGQASSPYQEHVRQTPSLRHQPLTGANTDYSTSTNYTTNTGSQGFTQPGFTNNTSNNFTTSYGTEGLTQPNFINNTNYGNTFPTSYETQGLSQPGFNNTGLQQGFSQQPIYSGTGYGTAFGTNSNFIPNSGTQNFSQQGFINGAALGTGLGMGTGLATSTDAQNFAQPGPNNGGFATSQSFSQPGQNTGFYTSINPSLKTGTSGTTTPSATMTQFGDSRGTFIFRPIEGKFKKDKDIVGKMDPYCKIKIGLHSGKTGVAKSEGTHPVWSDVITIDRKRNEQFAKIKVKDHDRLTLNDKIGEAKIPLNEVASKGKINQWFPIYKRDQMTGEVLMEISFQPRTNAI